MRERFGDRALGVALALAAEALLVLAVLSMALVDRPAKREEVALTSVALRPQAQPKAEEPAAKPKPREETLQQSRPVPKPVERPPEPPKAPDTRSAPPLILLSKNDMASANIAALPRPPQPAPGRMPMGPVDSGVPGDSKRVGTAPNGQPMYAAAWYREPYHDELSGYLSTASGPGWALIACRTAPNFRVEDCVGLDEYPDNSRLLRAVLAAAWQFQVRPARVNGVSQVGSWVRIRIEYTQR